MRAPTAPPDHAPISAVSLSPLNAISATNLRILAHLRNGDVTLTGLASSLGRTRQSVHYALGKLKRSGLVTEVKGDVRSTWGLAAPTLSMYIPLAGQAKAIRVEVRFE